jgi:DNA-binding response OmpR family regulator
MSERILVVDDEAGIAETVGAYFRHEGWLADVAYDSRGAMALADQFVYDLAVIDLMLPDLPGEVLCGQLRTSRPSMAVIMLTARTGPEAVVSGLDAGADDYVEKPFSPRELVARARAVLRRTRTNATAILHMAGLKIDRGICAVHRAGARIDLTATEWKLLDRLASQPGRIFTRAELVDAVMGDDWDHFDRTIDVHIKNLRRKIEVDPTRPQVVATARGLGYRYGGPASQ